MQEKQKINELLSTLNNKEKIKFKSRNGFHLFDPDEIFYIVSEGNYSWIYLTNGVNELVTMQIGKIFELLEDKDFFRISRQNVINLRYLYKLDKPRKCCYLKVDEKIIEFNMVKDKVNKLLQII
jgi:two-component system LytT family response regulator